MARLKKERLPSTTVVGACPYCGAEPFYVDKPSQRSYHPHPTCGRFLEECRSRGASCLGYVFLTNLPKKRC